MYAVVIAKRPQRCKRRNLKKEEEMFFDNKVFLENDKAVELYEYAKSLPIFDYHCHLAPQDILGDKVFQI